MTDAEKEREREIESAEKFLEQLVEREKIKESESENHFEFG